ncbi:MAG: NAD(P)-dependent oxidoreductase [Thermodesulfobacteriota bacterium]
MTEILITGGAGNFGRTLAQALREKGYALRLLDLPDRDFSFCADWGGCRVFKADILDPVGMAPAVSGVDWVFHLAAILPPASEKDRDRTFLINAEGTRRLLKACAKADIPPKVVLASSISVYGDTSAESDLITPDHPVNPNDWYAASKVEAEGILQVSGLPWINLRIAAVVIPEFLDPPDQWPFMAEQRIELIALADLIQALANLVETPEALDRTLIISGGPEWRMTGADYVRRWAEVMDIPFDEMNFLDRPGWLNWYDTAASQALLNYQHTTRDEFFRQLGQAVAEALA